MLIKCISEKLNIIEKANESYVLNNAIIINFSDIKNRVNNIAKLEIISFKFEIAINNIIT